MKSHLGELKKKSAKTIDDIKRNYEKDIKPHFGKMLMSDVDLPMILSWFNKLTERTEGGANHCLSILKAMFTLCMALGFVSITLVCLLRKTRTRKELGHLPRAN